MIRELLNDYIRIHSFSHSLHNPNELDAYVIRDEWSESISSRGLKRVKIVRRCGVVSCALFGNNFEDSWVGFAIVNLWPKTCMHTIIVSPRTIYTKLVCLSVTEANWHRQRAFWSITKGCCYCRPGLQRGVATVCQAYGGVIPIMSRLPIQE